MGKAVARHTKSKAERLIEAETALRMHLAGVEDAAICRELRISRSTLVRRIRWALDQVVDPTVEQYREEAQARIRESRRRIYDTLSREQVSIDVLTGRPVMVPLCGPTEVAALTGRLRDLEELEARLRGGFAPTRVDVKHTVQDAFGVLLEELGVNDVPGVDAQGARV